jgi:hypothetical protein
MFRKAFKLEAETQPNAGSKFVARNIEQFAFAFVRVASQGRFIASECSVRQCNLYAATESRSQPSMQLHVPVPSRFDLPPSTWLSNFDGSKVVEMTSEKDG